jgi:hemerythrin
MNKISKITVSTGIFWIDIPKADVRILCGSPADSVKHLIKRGLILPVEKNGVTFETGPNIILLSDLMVQNGEFSNLSEFPVLQMLYRQGMIIPNHPGNSGVKPMLIGSKKQVQSQMDYIYRGNYGLVSKEEIMNSDISEEFAEELMQLKLKFAFGKIKDTKELLDYLYVVGKNNKLEVRNGVYIERLQTNVFEISYEDEKVLVDLNLKDNDEYKVPYKLGYHDFKREYFAVIHSGEGDGWDINKPCASSILMYQGKIYLIDAGPNIMHSLNALGISINEIEGIFHTHSHDDHFVGLTALIQTDTKIKYFSSKLVRRSVSKKFATLLGFNDEDFASYFDIHDLNLDEWNNIDGLEVKPILSPHPVETNVFLFRTISSNGYHTYAHYTDIVSLGLLEGMIKTEDKAGITQELFDKTKRVYLKKVDLKKIDIGGGMIHGVSDDFKHDKSKKILLSHTSLDLTLTQKEIGSSSPFGIIDTLIPNYQDFSMRQAYHFLQSYFIGTPDYQLKTILNNRVVTFNPETVILKEGELNRHIYLIITGTVEVIQTDTDTYNIISAGALVGELTSLMGVEAMETYRALSFLQALEIPVNLYKLFVRNNKLYSQIEDLNLKRDFLQKSWLFGDNISYSVQNRVAQSMHLKKLKKGETIERDGSLFIIKSGSIAKKIDGVVYDELKNGDFFGEEMALFNIPSIFDIEALEDTMVYSISKEAELKDIPIIHWKGFETFEKRRTLVFKQQNDENKIEWKDAYSLGIEEIDKQHIKLFDITNSILALIDDEAKFETVSEKIKELIEFTDEHFRDEEQFMQDKNYQFLRTHKKRHKELVEQLAEFSTTLKSELEEGKLKVDFIDFFKNWLINHILSEDRKYALILK